MLTENEVVDAVVKHLKSTGYSIVSTCRTDQRGDDIVAVSVSSGRKLLVEAKGATTSKDSKRKGKPFSPAQVHSHVAVAFFRAAALRGRYVEEHVDVAIALPQTHHHVRHVRQLLWAVSRLSITVFFVDQLGQVHELS